MKPFAVFTLSLVLVLPLFAGAQTITATASSTASVTLPDAGTLPTSSFYFLKSWKEGIQLLFTWDTKAKVEKHLYLAEVRLAEYQKLVENGDIEEATVTLKNYQEHRDKAVEKAKDLEEKDAAEVQVKIDEDSVHLQEVLSMSLGKLSNESKTSGEGVEAKYELVTPPAVSEKKSDAKVAPVPPKPKEETPPSDVSRCGDKEYVSGEIMVGFNADVTLEQQKNLVAGLGVSAKESLGASLNLNALLVTVPAGQENDFLFKFKQSKWVKYAELNWCAHTTAL